MWAIFLFILGIFGIVLINLFGNITTTNQQDYTLIKNAVEAAMNDSIDYASYQVGFYLCFDTKTLPRDKDGRIIINSKKDYHIVLRTVNLQPSEVAGCDLLKGKIKINKEVFVESFLRRFANNVHNNKSFEVTIQEVIEYPPKVSVRVDTYNTYSGTPKSSVIEGDFDKGDFNIRNQIDAILENKG